MSLPMPILLDQDEVVVAYYHVAEVYPYVLPLCLWRAFEYAAYKRYKLLEPVLDIGCGDGRFFHLVWPEITQVVGVDIEPGIVDAARRSDVYREVQLTPAHKLPFTSNQFASVFANCSLEHMDNLSEVLRSIWRCLRPGGTFLFSVVTDKLVDQTGLALFLSQAGVWQRARAVQAAWQKYHHLVSPLPIKEWAKRLAEADFEVLEYIPILAQPTGSLFLLLDQVWHLKTNGGEMGDQAYQYLRTLPNMPQAFGQILMGFLQAEYDRTEGIGVIFYARKGGGEL